MMKMVFETETSYQFGPWQLKEVGIHRGVDKAKGPTVVKKSPQD